MIELLCTLALLVAMFRRATRQPARTNDRRPPFARGARTG